MYPEQEGRMMVSGSDATAKNQPIIPGLCESLNKEVRSIRESSLFIGEMVNKISPIAPSPSPSDVRTENGYDRPPNLEDQLRFLVSQLQDIQSYQERVAKHLSSVIGG